MEASDKREATKLLKELFSAFPSMAASIESAQVYLSVVAEYRVDALKNAVQRFIRGEVAEHNGRFVPSTAELSRVVRDIDWQLRENELFKLYGPSTWVDFGHGRIELRGLSDKEKDRVIDLHGLTADGRNLAFLSIEDKRAALDPTAIPAPNRVPVPKLQRMK